MDNDSSAGGLDLNILANELNQNRPMTQAGWVNAFASDM